MRAGRAGAFTQAVHLRRPARREDHDIDGSTPMRILVTGAAGMIGRKLTERLVKDGSLNGRAFNTLTLTDVFVPAKPAGFADTIHIVTADLATPGVADELIGGRPDVIFHTAGIVSAEAELDFDKGYRSNLDGMQALLEAIHRAGYRPRLVFTSSCAAFGGPFPDAIGDTFHLTPHTSYGTQKAICELLLADYSRRGFVDGVGLRLPAICVRPGTPNRAASGFFSSIIREPLGGQEAVLPVDENVLHTHASPRAAVGFLIHAAGLSREQLGSRINLTMPGVSCTVAEQIAALRRIAGDKVVARIRREPDPLVIRIVDGWPHRFDPARALALGFTAERSFDDIIRIHIDDERGGVIQ
jgi:D-erythronate 2-dehydrogenase